MDPDQVLRDLRCMMQKLSEYPEQEDAQDLLFGIVAKVEDLDGWLSSGGFLPADWTKNA